MLFSKSERQVTSPGSNPTSGRLYQLQSSRFNRTLYCTFDMAKLRVIFIHKRLQAPHSRSTRTSSLTTPALMSGKSISKSSSKKKQKKSLKKHFKRQTAPFNGIDKSEGFKRREKLREACRRITYECESDGYGQLILWFTSLQMPECNCRVRYRGGC